jgi:hypothetical protein
MQFETNGFSEEILTDNYILLYILQFKVFLKIGIHSIKNILLMRVVLLMTKV